MNDLKTLEALRLHDSSAHPLGLPYSLGDGYLCTYNIVYRNIRKAFLDIGGKLTKDDYCQISVLPYLALLDYLRTNRIVCVDNVTPFKKAISRRGIDPQFELLLKSAGFPNTNAPLHEAVHCIAHRLLNKSHTNSTPLKIFVAEALAGTLEVMAWASIRNQNDLTFFNINTHHPATMVQVITLKNAVQEMGHKSIFLFLFHSFLGRMYLNDNFNQTAYEKLCLASGITIKPEFKKILSKIFSYTNIALIYRMHLSGLFLQCMGHTGPLWNHINSDYLNEVSKSKLIKSVIERVYKIAITPDKTKLDKKSHDASVCYAITSDEKYLKMVKRSISSLRKFNATIPIYLFVFGNMTKSTLSYLKKLNVNVENPKTTHNNPYFLKWLALSNVPTERVLFLDADTIIRSDISGIIKNHIKADFYARREFGTLKKSYWIGDLKINNQIHHDDYTNNCKLLGGKPVPIFNAGVMLFNNFSHKILAGQNLKVIFDDLIKGKYPYPSRNHYIRDEIAFSLHLSKMTKMSWGLFAKEDVSFYLEVQKGVVTNPGTIMHITNEMYPHFLKNLYPRIIADQSV